MSERPYFTIGITLGDMNGIGPEIILKVLSDKRIMAHCMPVVYGSAKTLSYYKKLLGLDDFSFHIAKDITQLSRKHPSVINCWQEEVNITPGDANTEMGKYALIALEKAVDDLKAGHLDAIVTAPVNKFNIQQHDPNFRGQTEYITARLEETDSMMVLASPELVVGLVTTHVPLRDVPALVTPEKVAAKIRLMHQMLRKDMLIAKPRIAVFGLNPHAGDSGLLGHEDKDIIQPAIDSCHKEGILAFGPYAADGFFGAGHQRKFDGIVAMYHDQGLVGFKALSFGTGINYTAGLSVVRTSPDHGTAYDKAGKNIANPDSMRSALFMAIDILGNRSTYTDMHRNPLRKQTFAADR